MDFTNADIKSKLSAFLMLNKTFFISSTLGSLVLLPIVRAGMMTEESGEMMMVC